MQGKGEGAISPGADPNRSGGGVGDDVPGPAAAHSSPNAAGPGELGAARPGGRQLPPDFVFRLKENTLEQPPKLASGGDTAAGTRGSGRGLRHLEGLRSPLEPALGSGQPERALPALPPTRPLTPSRATRGTSKGIKAGKGQATRAQLFFPSRPSSQLFCFWLLASLGSKMFGVGGEEICRKKPAPHGTQPGKQCGLQKQETG